jgi:hypothetical protein
MTKAKLAVVSLVAALGVSGAASASASAHEFIVEGKAIGESEDILSSFKSEGTSFFASVSHTKVEIKCAKDKGSVALEFFGKTKGSITYEECKAYQLNAKRELTLLKCTVPNTKIFFIDHLITFKAKVADEFEPEGTSFGEFKVTGGECPIGGAYSLKGTVIGIQPEAEVEKETHLTEFVPTEAGSQKLELGEGAAELVGTEELTLPEGKKGSEK